MKKNVKTNLDERIAELEQLITDKYPNAQFGAGIDQKDLQAFEIANGLKVPQELIPFYTWHNGIHIDSKLYLPSLEEAYKLFKILNHAHKPHGGIKNVALATLEELEKFLSPPDENSPQYDEVSAL